MKRLRSLCLVGLLVVGTVALAVGPVTGASTGVVSISTTTTPDRPAPGDTVTISTTVSNPEAGSSSFQLRSVEVRETTADNSTLYNSTDESSTIEPGESTTRDLGVDIEESGQQQFVLHVQVLSDGDVVNFERNVTVTAGETDPALSLSGGDIGADGDATFDLSVSNARTEPIRAVTVDVSAGDIQFDEDRHVVSQLASGAETTLKLPASDVEPGEKTVEAAVTYTTNDGEFKSVTRELTTTADSAENPGEVSLSGIDVSGADGELQISGQANNAGETNVSGVTVTVEDGPYSLGEAQSSAFVGRLDASTSSDFQLGATVPDDTTTATIPLTVAYRLDGQEVTRTVTVQEDFSSSGKVNLTGVRIEQTGSRLTVRGSASNLGTSNVSAVIVSVGQNERIQPAQSQSSYFAGNVAQSEFKSFQVDARLTGDTNETVSVPVEVSYRVNGQRIDTTTTVPYTPRATGPAAEQSQRDSSVPIVLIGGVVLVVVAGGLGYRRYR
ncbi:MULTISPECIES: hypothetical protein [Halomicrobium]|uniref:CARDB domain-containing protein n=2 Tax=Halomicrobium mukohataei TaxID=57705 RepID=C7P3G0_HALMD|nr:MULTISPECIES: hypothetical protein [Halomicrobium]ACV47632.1 hypothetical protein Hmuk_1517 [Halomicrobium mukohataei DSM 12286]QCD66090.1 hypothetical protein E5139_10720 [Halomicrobium mukohataei]QFR20895.1 hypothetical protein GBQ70_10715 [Halomicrobium sp. ZPS1]